MVKDIFPSYTILTVSLQGNFSWWVADWRGPGCRMGCRMPPLGKRGPTRKNGTHPHHPYCMLDVTILDVLSYLVSNLIALMVNNLFLQILLLCRGVRRESSTSLGCFSRRSHVSCRGDEREYNSRRKLYPGK